ncbi:MAG TPA: hypothetical protein VMT03_15145 [Polyangia bacterium]|nr:hypothetical protein [Polyangia bacterium]
MTPSFLDQVNGLAATDQPFALRSFWESPRSTATWSQSSDAAAQSIQPVWNLSGDRLLAGIYTKPDDGQKRADAILFDLPTGDSRVLGERGKVAAVGQPRMLGIFHFDGQDGDLTAVDLDSGKPTVLAPEFAVTGFAEPRGVDQLAPGGQVAYQFQARSESPYDGIWVVDAP